MSIPIPTFGHTPLVGGDLENDYNEATTNIKDVGCRFEKTLLICRYGPVGHVPAPHRGAATATVSLAETSLFSPFSKSF
jgi:hypothetical protein